MTDRKFRFRRPKNTDERIEAIYEEFCTTPTANGAGQAETLKDYVAGLLKQTRNAEWQLKRDKLSEEYSVSFALGILAFVAVVFLMNGWSESRDWEWLNRHRFAIRLWGIAFAAVYVGVSIERSSLFKKLWSFGFTKLATSLAISALIIFSTGKASSLINGVFGVDASSFPFTRAYIAGLLAFQYASPLLVVVALFAAVHAIDLAGYIRSKISADYSYDFPAWNSFAFLILAVSVLYFSWQWIYRDFSEVTFPARIYRLAHVLDFNARHSCVNIKDGVSVVFIGSEHSKVLVDMSKVQTEDIETFVNRVSSNDIEIPKKFFVLPCEPGTRGQ